MTQLARTERLPMLHSLPVIQPEALPLPGRKPAWLKVRAPGGPNYMRLKGRLREWNLHSVCEEAHCPTIGECWEEATATFMILGDVCTRNCGYCAIAHGRPTGGDREEPERVARAVRDLELEYVVITSVNRDDLADGGAAHWAATVRAVRRYAPRCRVEVLIPDFQGDAAALATVIDAAPDILNHNTETVPRLYRVARHGGRYERTLELFRRARATAPALPTKSGIILGLGEERHELLVTMRDLVDVGVSILTLGQYLRPSAQHLPVSRYYRPEEFAELADAGRALGFTHVEAGPLVRSSYHAKKQADSAATDVRGAEPGAATDVRGAEPGAATDVRGAEPGAATDVRGAEPGAATDVRGAEPGAATDVRGAEPGAATDVRGAEPGASRTGHPRSEPTADLL